LNTALAVNAKVFDSPPIVQITHGERTQSPTISLPAVEQVGVYRTK